MSESAAILLMMNNYLHDVATAMLLATGFVMLQIWKSLDTVPEEPAVRLTIKLYHRMTRLALWALVWILIGGIPRMIFYTEFEWSGMAGRGQIPALMVKHVLAFSLVAYGFVLWSRIRRKLGVLAQGPDAAGIK